MNSHVKNFDKGQIVSVETGGRSKTREYDNYLEASAEAKNEAVSSQLKDAINNLLIIWLTKLKTSFK